MNVLIIDDDGDDSAIFCDALKEVAPNVKCFISSSADTALAYLQGDIELPAYIFLDVNMYPIGGKECLIQLRQIAKLRDINIIMYSGMLTEKTIKEFKDIGATEVFIKPNSYTELCSRLGEMIR